MGNKDTVIHSHTVPVAYLANFGINGNEQRESRIYFYNVHENKTNQAKVGKFPVINHFYDINELGEQKQIIEKFFGNKIERIAVNASDKEVKVSVWNSINVGLINFLANLY